MKEDAAELRARFLLDLRSRGFSDLALLRAMERAPRALFLPQRYEDLAWRDLALPIACGQTASPPLAVAAMIEALGVEPSHRVLEIGPGSGYSTALLAQCAGQVVALERAEPLAAEALARLSALGHGNVELMWADGLSPSPALGAFDRVLVNALAPAGIADWLPLLGPDGRLAAATEEGGRQKLILFADGEARIVEPAVDVRIRAFSPLTPGLAAAR